MGHPTPRIKALAQAGITEFIQSLSGRILTVIIDQPLSMPEDIQRFAWGHIDRFVQPGDQVRLYSFSALVPGEYIRLRFSGARVIVALSRQLEEP